MLIASYKESQKFSTAFTPFMAKWFAHLIIPKAFAKFILPEIQVLSHSGSVFCKGWDIHHFVHWDIGWH